MIRKIRQKLNGLFPGGEDRGVSPVIGVILMVAITVILAAVIGAFVLGLGGDLDSQAAPTANLDISGDSGTITIEHKQGDNLDSDDLRVILRDTDDNNIGVVESAQLDDLSVGDTTTITAGTAATVNTANTNIVTAQVIHEPSGSMIGSGNVDSANLKTEDAAEPSQVSAR